MRLMSHAMRLCAYLRMVWVMMDMGRYMDKAIIGHVKLGHMWRG